MRPSTPVPQKSLIRLSERFTETANVYHTGRKLCTTDKDLHTKLKFYALLALNCERENHGIGFGLFTFGLR